MSDLSPSPPSPALGLEPSARRAPTVTAIGSPGNHLGRTLGRFLACLRLQDIAMLQGSPLLGAMVAMRASVLESLPALALLALANFCLVAHIFTLNDWSGLATDLTDPNKAARVFTARGVGRAELGGLSIGLLAASLLLFGLLGPIAFGLALAIAALSALYSLPIFDWKGKPLLSTATHWVGGALHFLLGYALGGALDGRGLAASVFFGLVFAAGHLTQEVRDHASDVASAIRTNAAILGPRRAFAGSLGLFALAHGVLLLLALQGTLPRSLAAVPVLFSVQLRWSAETFARGLTYESVRRLQGRYRALYALIGLAMAAALWWAPV